VRTEEDVLEKDLRGVLDDRVWRLVCEAAPALRLANWTSEDLAGSALAARAEWTSADLDRIPDLAAMLIEGPAERIAAASRQLAAREGAVVPLHLGTPLHLLVEEVSVSINTTAAGGNASLMAIA
jgi:delta 1-pyrroline-5-carboxylate dehydrogenase